MNKILTFLALCYGLFGSLETLGQGWKWGSGDVSPDCGFEGTATAIDKWSNVYIAGYIYGGGGVTSFGSFSVTASSGGMVISKTEIGRASCRERV